MTGTLVIRNFKGNDGDLSPQGPEMVVNAGYFGIHWFLYCKFVIDYRIASVLVMQESSCGGRGPNVSLLLHLLKYLNVGIWDECLSGSCGCYIDMDLSGGSLIQCLVSD